MTPSLAVKAGEENPVNPMIRVCNTVALAGMLTPLIIWLDRSTPPDTQWATFTLDLFARSAIWLIFVASIAYLRTTFCRHPVQ